MNTARFFSQNAVRATSVGVPFGRVLFDQGQAGDAFYVVQSGRLRVIKRDAEGHSRTVGYLYAGDHFGEGALLTGQGHRATVRAVEDSDVLRVPKDQFFKVLKKEAGLKAYLEDHVAQIAYRNFTRFLKGNVSAEVMRSLFARLKREEVARGKPVVDPDGRFYFIGQGRVEVGSANGAAILRAGDFFGESNRTHAIRCPRDSVLFSIDKSDLNTLKEMMPALGAVLEMGRLSRAEQNANGTSRNRSATVGDGESVRSDRSTRVRSDKKRDAKSNGVALETDAAKPDAPTSFRFPFLKQHDQSDCGAACLGMICKYYKMPIGLNRLRDMSNVSRHGTSLAALAEAAETLGFVTRGVRTGYEALMRAELPAILHWEGNHFVVLYQITKKEVKLADPGVGIRKLSRAEFEKAWTNMALLLEYTDRVAENEPSRSSFKRFFPLIRPYAGILIEVLLASLVLSLFGLASPIFMQTIVDQVLVHHDEDLLNLMLVGMVVVALFQMGTSTLRMYLIGYVSARLSLSMLSRFTAICSPCPCGSSPCGARAI